MPSDEQPATDVATSPSASASGDVHAENAVLREVNAQLEGRIAAAEQLIETLRAEALERRAEVRRLAESLPATMSRRAMLAAMIRDAGRHPDKAGVAKRAARKLARAPRRAVRTVLRRGRPGR